MLKSTRARVLAAAVVAPALITAIPSAAWAASFDIRTTSTSTDGYAHAWGDVTYIDKNSVKVVSTVADICPADGDGAYLWLEIIYVDATRDTVSVNWDDGGCSNGTRGQQSQTWNPGRNIAKVRLKLEEKDAGSAASETVYSTWKDNPNT